MLPAGAESCQVAHPALLAPATRSEYAKSSKIEQLAWSSALEIGAFASVKRRSRRHGPGLWVAVMQMSSDADVDPDLAALAIKQARGDLVEAIFLLRPGLRTRNP